MVGSPVKIRSVRKLVPSHAYSYEVVGADPAYHSPQLHAAELALVPENDEGGLHLRPLLHAEHHPTAAYPLQVATQTLHIHLPRLYLQRNQGNKPRPPSGFKGQLINMAALMSSHCLGSWRALGLGLRFVARPVTAGARLYTENAPSRGPKYTTELAEATMSLSATRPLPVYRVMDAAGGVLDPQQDPNVSGMLVATVAVLNGYGIALGVSPGNERGAIPI